MVAIKSTGQPLNMKDIWPGLPWTWQDTHRIQDECRQRAIEAGITEEPKLSFAAAREWEKWLQSFPRYGERQQIMKRIYPMKISKPKPVFTEEEIDYMIARFFGANDEIGQSILKKLQLTLED